MSELLQGLAKMTGNPKKDKANPVKKKNNKNSRAFNVANIVRTKRTMQRNSDLEQRKEVVPLLSRGEDLPPPALVVVMGPQGAGKSTLIRSLVKLFSAQNLSDTVGPITVVAGKKRRVTFFECPCDLYSMTDLAKVADLVLLMVDASYGYEMETFEFLNQLQLHGFPKVMGIMTHLDAFKNNKTLQNAKKAIKHRFWTEIYKGKSVVVPLLIMVSASVYIEQTYGHPSVHPFIMWPQLCTMMNHNFHTPSLSDIVLQERRCSSSWASSMASTVSTRSSVSLSTSVELSSDPSSGGIPIRTYWWTGSRTLPRSLGRGRRSNRAGTAKWLFSAMCVDLI